MGELFPPRLERVAFGLQLAPAFVRWLQPAVEVGVR